MSSYARRAPSSAGSAAPKGAKGARNNAARDAQRRLQQMMIGQADDDYEYDQREYQAPVAAPAPVARPRPPPVAPVPRTQAMAYQSTVSPDSGSSDSQVYRRQLSNSTRSNSVQRRYGAEETAVAAVGNRDMDQLRRESVKLQDDIDILEEQNEVLYEKLREAEEHLKESQLRCQELEKQVANLGGGVSIEARLLAKKEAALKQREAALKAATEQSRDVTQTELNNLRLEVEAAREEALAAGDLARLYESELKTLKQMTNKLMLTADEKEEVIMKRCWLARYWLLAKNFDIHAEVSTSQADTWQSYAPLPLETVLAVGLKAREENNWANRDKDRDSTAAIRESGASADDPSHPSAQGSGLKPLATDVNIESMFAVEKGLRDLAALKIEEGVLFAIAQHRRPAPIRLGSNAGVPTEPPRLQESIELSEEEVEDVQFKQNWLVYFWRRAKSMGIEPDLSDERLQYWVARLNFPPKAHDAVDVERGLLELRKLNIEGQLWAHARSVGATEVSQGRKMMSPASSASSMPNQDAV